MSKTLVPLVQVRVLRDGRPFSPKINEPFRFEDNEIADMDNLTKKSGKQHYREPKDETKEIEAAPKSKAAKPAKAPKNPVAEPASPEGDDNNAGDAKSPEGDADL